MRKIKKGSLLIDILVALMLITIIVYVAYILSTNSINKRQQIVKERDAMLVAENIMSRELSKGIYYVQSEPGLTQEEINLSKTDYQRTIQELYDSTRRLPVDTATDAPFLAPNSGYQYQIIVENFENNEFTLTSTSTSLKKITVRVYYPIKVNKYSTSDSDKLANKSDEAVRDKASLEEEYRVVTLTTLKSARQYEVTQ